MRVDGLNAWMSFHKANRSATCFRIGRCHLWLYIWAQMCIIAGHSSLWDLTWSTNSFPLNTTTYESFAPVVRLCRIVAEEKRPRKKIQLAEYKQTSPKYGGRPTIYDTRVQLADEFSLRGNQHLKNHLMHFKPVYKSVPGKKSSHWN